VPTFRPATEPIGLQVTKTARSLRRAFECALADAGGSLPTWLVLVSVKAEHPGAQRALAEAVGIEGPTLTHHLNRMESEGLITRTRDPENRRAHLVELTEAGEAAFQRLLPVVVAFDARLRTGFDDEEIAALSGALERLHTNIHEDKHVHDPNGHDAHPGHDKERP